MICNPTKICLKIPKHATISLYHLNLEIGIIYMKIVIAVLDILRDKNGMVKETGCWKTWVIQVYYVLVTFRLHFKPNWYQI